MYTRLQTHNPTKMPQPPPPPPPYLQRNRPPKPTAEDPITSLSRERHNLTTPTSSIELPGPEEIIIARGTINQHPILIPLTSTPSNHSTSAQRNLDRDRITESSRDRSVGRSQESGNRNRKDQVPETAKQRFKSSVEVENGIFGAKDHEEGDSDREGLAGEAALLAYSGGVRTRRSLAERLQEKIRLRRGQS